MTALGACGSLPTGTTVTLNEATTIASAYALSAFMTTAPNVGSSATNHQGLANAFLTVADLVNLTTGAVPSFTPGYPTNLAGDSAVVDNSTVPQARINTLANILNSCAGTNGSGCGALFQAATPPATGSIAPATTLQAALDIAQNPGNNISGANGLFALAPTSPSTAPFTPFLTTAPNDFTLALTFTGGGLGISPALGLTLNNSGQPVNGGMAIDATGNIWIWVTATNTFVSAPLVAEFNNQGVPQTGNVTLDAAQANVTQFGGDSLSTFGNPSNTPNNAGNPGAIAVDPSNNLWIGALDGSDIARSPFPASPCRT